MSDAVAELASLFELAQTSIDQPTQRDHLDSALSDLARRTVGADSVDLISQPV